MKLATLAIGAALGALAGKVWWSAAPIITVHLHGGEPEADKTTPSSGMYL